MLQVYGQQLCEKPAIGPACLMFELGDQAVDRKAKALGSFNPLERGWLAQAFTTDLTFDRKWQCANPALCAQPG